MCGISFTFNHNIGFIDIADYAQLSYIKWVSSINDLLGKVQLGWVIRALYHSPITHAVAVTPDVTIFYAHSPFIEGRFIFMKVISHL